MTLTEKRMAHQHANEALNSAYRALSQIGIAGQYDPSLIKYREPLRVWYETVRAKMKEEK